MKTITKVFPDTLAWLYKLAEVKPDAETNTISKSTAKNNTPPSFNAQNSV